MSISEQAAGQSTPSKAESTRTWRAVPGDPTSHQPTELHVPAQRAPGGTAVPAGPSAPGPVPARRTGLSPVVVALVTLAVFFAVLAGLLRFAVAPALMVLPADQTAEVVLVADDASYVSIDGTTGVRARTGRSIRVVQEIRGDTTAATEDKVAWNSYTTSVDRVDGKVFSQSTERQELDRHTSLPACCGGAVDGRPVTREGYTVKFPFHTKPVDHPVFEGAVRSALPARFAGRTTIDGLPVYRFELAVPQTSMGPKTGVPGVLFGSKTPVDGEVFLTSTRRLWVEPVSGMIVAVEADRRQVVRAADGEEVAVFDAKLSFDEKTRADSLAAARSNKGLITLVETTAPAAGLVLALLALSGAALLHRRRVLRDSR